MKLSFSWKNKEKIKQAGVSLRKVENQIIKQDRTVKANGFGLNYLPQGQYLISLKKLLMMRTYFLSVVR
jgi:hypothetical protein